MPSELDQAIALIRNMHLINQLMALAHESGDIVAVLQRHVYQGQALDLSNLTQRLARVEEAVNSARKLLGSADA